MRAGHRGLSHPHRPARRVPTANTPAVCLHLDLNAPSFIYFSVLIAGAGVSGTQVWAQDSHPQLTPVTETHAQLIWF